VGQSERLQGRLHRAASGAASLGGTIVLLIYRIAHPIS
jgi:hypothetical protein